MISSKTLKIAIGSLLCLAGSSTVSAQFETDSEFWSQSHFRDQFLASYAVDTKITPPLTEEEQVEFKAILDYLATPGASKQVALDMLTPHVTATGSAAFDFIGANFYAELKQTKNAVKFYDQAAKKFPNFLRAHRNGAIMKVQLGSFTAARESFTKAINLGAKDGVVMGLLGLCYVSTEQYISAETAYREAIVLQPDVKDWQLGLAKALSLQGKNEETIAVIEQILTTEPDNEILWTVQANAYLGREDAEMSVAIHEIIDRLGKSTADSLVYMGNVYMSRDLNDLALTYFQRAIKKDDSLKAEVHISVAESLMGRGAFPQSEETLKAVKVQYKDLNADDSLRVLRLESQLAIAQNQGEKVIPILEKLIERDPLDGQALLMLADFYSGKDDIDSYARSDLYFKRATKVSEYEVRALISWAQSYVGRKMFGKAIPLLETANVKQPQEYITRYLEQVRKVHLAQLGLN